MYREYCKAYAKEFNTQMQSPLTEKPWKLPNKDGDVPDDNTMDKFDLVFIGSYEYVPDQLTYDMQLMKEKFGVDMATATDEQIKGFSTWKARQEAIARKKNNVSFDVDKARAEREAREQEAVSAENVALQNELMEIATSNGLSGREITNSVVLHVKAMKDDYLWTTIFAGLENREFRLLKCIFALINIGLSTPEKLGEKVKTGDMSFLKDSAFLLEGGFEKRTTWWCRGYAALIKNCKYHGCTAEEAEAAVEKVEALEEQDEADY